MPKRVGHVSVPARNSRSITVRTRAWRVVRPLLVVGIALAAIAFVYAMGLPDVGGAFLLSGLLLVVFLYVRSGALSPVSHQRRHFSTIRNCARWEFAKAMICAGAGLDIVRLIFISHGDRVLTVSVVSEAAFYAILALWCLGVVAFLARSFAAYLLSLRN
jgi:hypothetical protein